MEADDGRSRGRRRCGGCQAISAQIRSLWRKAQAVHTTHATPRHWGVNESDGVWENKESYAQSGPMKLSMCAQAFVSSSSFRCISSPPVWTYDSPDPGCASSLTCSSCCYGPPPPPPPPPEPAAVRFCSRGSGCRLDPRVPIARYIRYTYIRVDTTSAVGSFRVLALSPYGRAGCTVHHTHASSMCVCMYSMRVRCSASEGDLVESYQPRSEDSIILSFFGD